MTVYVIREGVVVEKAGLALRQTSDSARSDFPSPRLSRLEPFASPVTGKEITSWRQRDRDMDAAGACDPRDLPPPTKGRANARRTGDDSTFQWSDPPA